MGIEDLKNIKLPQSSSAKTAETNNNQTVAKSSGTSNQTSKNNSVTSDSKQAPTSSSGGIKKVSSSVKTAETTNNQTAPNSSVISNSKQQSINSVQPTNNRTTSNSSVSSNSKQQSTNSAQPTNNRTETKLLNKGWQNITLKITTLSPIHIGNGEVYEPTNFIIDKDNILYGFKEELFIRALPPVQINGYMESAKKGFIALHQFTKANSEIAKKVANDKVKVKTGLSNGYEDKLKNPKANFHIYKTSKTMSKNEQSELQAYIPGSSFKGAMLTSYLEYLFKTEYKSDKNRFEALSRNFFDLKGDQLFRYLKVSDSLVEKSSSTIGYAVNRSRSGECEDSQMANIVEAIDKNSIFKIDIRYDSNVLNINTILQSLNQHFKPIYDSVIHEFSDCSSPTVVSNLKVMKFDSPNKFILRVGKYSGARSISVAGVREIKIKTGRTTSEKQDEETTSWLFANTPKDITNLEPFGWLLIEIESK